MSLLSVGLRPIDRHVKSGFYHLGYKDRVKRFQYGGMFAKWNVGDDVNSEHASNLPHYPFIVARQGQSQLRCPSVRTYVRPHVRPFTLKLKEATCSIVEWVDVDKTNRSKKYSRSPKVKHEVTGPSIYGI